MELEQIIKSVPIEPYKVYPDGVLWNADCLTIMKWFPEKSVDLVLTDPPYGLNYNYDVYEDTLDNYISIINNIVPILINKSNIVALCSSTINLFLNKSPDWIIVCSWNTTGSYGRYGICQWFPVLMYGKDLSGFGKINGVLKSDLISISGGASVGFMRSKIEKYHPCPKPLNIILKLIRRLSNKNDLILDPFIGSGITAVACIELNRKFIGIEISEEYCKITDKQIMNAYEKKKQRELEL